MIILEFWKFDCLYDDYGVKTHLVTQIEESDLSQSVPMEASTRKGSDLRGKNSIRGGTHFAIISFKRPEIR